MIALPGYQVTEEIASGVSTTIYRGIRERDRKPVILKVLKAEYPALEEITRLRQEYTIVREIECPGIVKVYGMEKYRQGFALILEDVVGESLKQLFASKQIKLREILQIAISVTDTLGELHKIPIIHKDIKPSNIIINHETGQVKITDFGISSCLEVEIPTISNPHLLEGTLAYISPEQTGRMNRSIDYRSDFYSLGATFYELLTGQLPFEISDPMELVHCHIAKEPVPPHKLNDKIPEAVSSIVMKLLAKTAEERYQSATGLKYDLEICLSNLQMQGTIEKFTLGQRDRGSQLLIPQKLYGRESEVQVLMDAFDRVSNGATEMMLVSGYSGIGKTAIINEVHKPIVKARGYFISGKFDQFKRNIPYAALFQAFSDLIRQLLIEKSEQIAIWKQKLLDSLGTNGQVIIDVIPEVELIIGQQPDVPQLGAAESLNRFNRVFQQFIRVFCQPEHPLVIFLDDLQWADSASLKLIQLLITDSDSHYLLAIGAYRDNEVSPTHPLIQTLEKIQEMGAVTNNITIKPLALRHVSQLVSDTLGKVDDESGDRKKSLYHRNQIVGLVELIFNKTQGNPFFLTQLLKTLYSESLLVYDVSNGKWQWDLEEIQTVGVADYGIVELIARNIQKLSASTQKIVKLAACIGNQFNLEILAIANQESKTITAAQLWDALQAGLILPLSDAYKIPLAFQAVPEGGAEEIQDISITDLNVDYKFLHDRVQQAAYSLIPESERKATHLAIGNELLESTTLEEQKDNIFALVNQLNFGPDLLITQTEKDRLAKLNLIAGRKAKAAAAYEASVNYLSIALELLATESWTDHYDLTISIYLEAIEVEYLNSNFERSNLLSEVTLNQAKTLLEKLKVHELQLQAYTAQNQHSKAIELGQKVLEILSVSLEKTPPNELTIEELAELPKITEPDKLAAMRILKAVGDAAYVTDPQLYSYAVFTQVHFCMKYGNSPLSVIAYIDYSLIQCAILGDIDSGYRFGKLALRMLDRFDTKELKSTVLGIFNGHVRHWKEPVSETIEPLQDAIQSGLETGELLFSGYAAINYCTNSLFLGIHLEEVEKKTKQYIDFLANLKLEYHVSGMQIYYQALLNLLGKSTSVFKLIGAAFDESIMLPIFKQYNSLTALFWVHFLKVILLYLFADYAQAVKNAKLADRYVEAVPGLLAVAEHNFYYSLALLAHHPDVEEPEKVEYLNQVEVNQKIMKKWAYHAPSNFEHKYQLVEAEKARVLGDYAKAIELYEQAIKGAREQEYTQEEALANELAGEFHLERGHENLSRFYILESYYGYIRWGATSKVKDLQLRYPQFLSMIKPQKVTGTDLTRTATTTTTTGSGELLDLITVMKASQAISSEIVLDNLLAKLMEIVIESAGAQVGLLILDRTGELVIEAERRIDRDRVTVLQSIPVEESDRLPISMINYVARTKENLVLNHIAEDFKFASDPYIKAHQPKSVACVPLINQGKLLGILYLENNLASGVFTQSRIEILRILCSQAAISLENANLYENLQHSEASEREKAEQLEQSLTELKQAQLQLVQSEKMSALGQLVAGVAHEINNPVSFISGNVSHARGYVQDLFNLLRLYQEKFPNPGDEIEEEIEAIDLQYVREDLPKLISSMKEGTDRIREISTSLRTFSRADVSKKVAFQIHEGLDSTLMILKHRLKANQNRPAIEIVKEYGELPEVACFPGQLNQVFMNLLANAIDALDESNHGRSYDDIKTNPNQITVRTQVLPSNNSVVVGIKDNGPGIPDEVKERLFEHLFTTKPPGKGTGLGLSISRQIIVEKHGGKLSVNSAPGEGAEFAIEIPIG